jgi:hypothetical protein
MGLKKWANNKISKLTILDIGILKICVIGFALMIAVLVPQVLLLEWYWYGIIFLISYAYIMVVIFKK